MFKHFSQKTLRIIFSFISAIFLWTFVMDQENPVVEKSLKNIPVEYRNESSLNAKNLVFTDDSKITVDATVLGRKDHIAYLKPEDVEVFVDLSTSEYGEKVFPINFILKDTDVKMGNLSKDEVKLKFDVLSSKTFPIETQEIGKLPAGYDLQYLNISTENITYSGAERFINEIDRVVSVFDKSKIKNSSSFVSPITPLNKEGKEVKEVTSTIKEQTYTYKVNQKITLPVVYKTFNELPKDLKLVSIKVTPKSVTLTGDSAKIGKLKTRLQNSLSFNIDLSTVKYTYSQEYNIGNIDKSIKISELPKIKIEVANIESREFKIAKNNLNFQNLASNLEVESIVFDNPKFYAFATASELNLLSQKPLIFNVDLKNITEEGENKVYAVSNPIENVSFSLNKEDEQKSSLEIQLTLNIKKVKE